MSDPSKPQRWAVLIGVNYYGTAADPLRGCVSDVTNLEKYFLSAGVQAKHITKLTASEPPDLQSEHPLEEASSWPTYDNVTASLRAVIKNAAPGDLVYVHFSGHGTQPKGSALTTAHPGTGDLAMVLYDKDTGIRYLHSFVLASLLKEMIGKSLLVTVVLDCCFSGSVVRAATPGRSSARSLDYNPAIEAAHPLTDVEKVQAVSDNDTSRDARQVSKLMIQSNQYTMFCACGPHEIAEELCLGGSVAQYTGALSHFLLRTLKSLRGTKITARALYDHLRMKFHLHWPHQTPMWYGKRDLLFMDAVAKPDSEGFITVLSQPRGDVFHLDAGFAHGVSEGDEYAVYALDAKTPAFHGVVEDVGAVQSDLVISALVGKFSQRETRWKAKRLGLPSWKVPVRLSFETRDMQALVTKEMPFLQLIQEDDRDTSCTFNVVLNDKGRYEIQDSASKPVPCAPTVARDAPTAVEDILGSLQHIAKFKYIEGLENQNSDPSFEQSFAVYLKDEDGNKIESGGILEVYDGQQISITVENSGLDPLYLTIFDMGPLWQVEDILEEAGAEFQVVTPEQRGDEDQPEYTGTQTIELFMSIPDRARDQGIHVCDDVLKVFITSSASSFSALSLPELEGSSRGSGVPEKEGGQFGNISDLLSHLGGPTRAAGEVDNWTTRSFIVRTT